MLNLWIYSIIVGCTITRLYVPTSQYPLILAFVESWRPDKNIFHMPFGKMTIALHDVYHIMSLNALVSRDHQLEKLFCVIVIYLARNSID